MKRIALALIAVAVLAGTAGTAEAQSLWPANNVKYTCSGGNLEWIVFNLDSYANDLHRGTATIKPVGAPKEGRKVSFAKPKNIGPYGIPPTAWEFTINPYGPQCGNPEVGNYDFRVHDQYNGTILLDWSNCTEEGIYWGRCVGPGGGYY